MALEEKPCTNLITNVRAMIELVSSIKSSSPKQINEIPIIITPIWIRARLPIIGISFPTNGELMITAKE